MCGRIQSRRQLCNLLPQSLANTHANTVRQYSQCASENCTEVSIRQSAGRLTGA
jgi:hypothetical protein